MGFIGVGQGHPHVFARHWVAPDLLTDPPVVEKGPVPIQAICIKGCLSWPYPHLIIDMASHFLLLPSSP